MVAQAPWTAVFVTAPCPPNMVSEPYLQCNQSCEEEVSSIIKYFPMTTYLLKTTTMCNSVSLWEVWCDSQSHKLNLFVNYLGHLRPLWAANVTTFSDQGKSSPLLVSPWVGSSDPNSDPEDNEAKDRHISPYPSKPQNWGRRLVHTFFPNLLNPFKTIDFISLAPEIAALLFFW